MKGKAKLLSPLLLVAMLFSLIGAAVTFSVVGMPASAILLSSPSPKSMYLIADHGAGAFDAYEIHPDGTVTYQATYTLTHATDPSGIAIDEDTAILFVTSEFSGDMELVDAITFESLGYVTAPGATNLAGLAVDNATNTVYTVDRATNDLFVYTWDPVNKTLILQSTQDLANCTGAWGIALDDINGILYVADSLAGKVRGYNVTTWAEVKTFTPSQVPVGIAVDAVGGFIYTTAPDGSCAPIGGTPHPGTDLLVKTVIATGTETNVDLGHGGMGIAVDESTGYVYVTGGCSGDTLEAWDTTTTPDWTLIDTTGDIGNPAGICIPVAVTYNPLQLTKDEGVEHCVNAGAPINYTICYNNTLNDFAVHDVVITDNLSANVTFVSATHNGTYDNVTHTVTWDIGDLAAETPTACVYLKVQVNSTAPVNSTIINECIIDSDDTGVTTVYEETLVCEAIVPLGLEKDDGLQPGECVDPGANINYEICYDNLGNIVDVHNVTLVDYLSDEVDFVSATGPYTYDHVNHTVTWDLGTLLAGAEPECVDLVVEVHVGTTASTIINFCTIEGDEEGTSNEAYVLTDVCTECEQGMLQAEIIMPSAAAPVDVDGRIDGWYEEARFEGYFDGYSIGMWDCYIDGDFHGDVEGWFTGWYDGDYYDDYWVDRHIDGDMRGHFEGFHDGYFDGYVDGSFTGYKDGYFDGTVFEPVDDMVFWSDSYYHSGYIDDMFIDTYFDGSFYGDKYIGSYYGSHYGGYSVGDWQCDIDGYFEGYIEGYFSGWTSSWGDYDGWYDGWIDGYVDGHFEGWHEGYFDGYVDGVFSGYKGYWEGYNAYFYGDIAKAFLVTAKINNVGQVDVPSVYATLTIDGPAYVVCGDTKYVGTVTTDWPPPAEPYGYQEASWWVICEGPGEVSLTVTPFTTPPIAEKCITPDTVTIYQADLVVEIVHYPLCSVNPSQTFSIKAVIYNLNEYATVEDVIAFIEISDPKLAELIEGEPDEKELGDIPPGGSQEVSWTLHCNASGDVIITVDAIGTVPVYSDETCQECEIIGEPREAYVLADSVYVRQNCPADLEVVIDAPEKVSKCDDYEVYATVTNTGDRDAEDVNATIDLGAGVELVSPDATIVIGDLPRGWSETVSWTVHCNTTGAADIAVEATGTDVLTGAAIEDDDAVCVDQYDDMYVLITEPEDGVTFSSCTNFTVNARVYNANATECIYDVNVTISLEGEFELVEGNATQTIDIICPDDFKDVNWTVHCTGGGSGTITVVAETDDEPELWDEDEITVKQQEKAHLVATIYFPDPGDSFATCQYFHVKGSVENTGGATAENVKVGIGIAREVINETLGYGDNSTTEFTLDYGYGRFNMIIPGTLKVYVNGTLTTAYTIDYETNTITFTTAPETDLRVSADYSWADTLESDGSFDVDKWVRCLGDIPGGVEVPVMWTLHCTDPGDVVITLVPAGKDANIDGRYSISQNNVEPADVAIHQLGLDVEITEYPSSVDFCETFFINTEVTNWGDETIEDVLATITIDGHAELVGAQYVTKSLGDIRPGETHDVSWTLHCYGPDDAFIMVTASVDGTDAEISDDVYVYQYKDQELVVIIESPLGDEDTHIATCQEFTVSAKIYNYGEDTVTNVSACIYFDDYDYEGVPGIPPPLSVVPPPNATVEVGSIAPGEYRFITWTLHADWAVPDWDYDNGYDWGDMEVYINVDAWGYDIRTGEEIDDSDDIEIDLYPAAHLVVDISAPEDGSIIQICQNFDLTATVTNTGFADAWDVSMTISFDPEGSVQLTQGGYTQQVGSLAGHGQNGNATVTWHLHCKQVCSTTITVTAQGHDEYGYYIGFFMDLLDNPEDAGNMGAWAAWENPWDGGWAQDGDDWAPGAPIPDRFIKSDSITVKQVDANLVVDLSYPDEVYAGRVFAVTATITNTGNTDALGVDATITVAGPASVDGHKTNTKLVGTIGAGDSATVSWELECDEEGGINVAMSASGDNTNIAADSGAVQQVKAPAGWGGLIWGLIGAAIILGIFICVCCWLRRPKA